MTFNEKVKQMIIKMFEIISTKEITYLKGLDRRISIDKYGKFNYWKIYAANNSKIWDFLNQLEDDSLYTLIPILMIDQMNLILF